MKRMIYFVLTVLSVTFPAWLFSITGEVPIFIRIASVVVFSVSLERLLRNMNNER